jgi:hypothetical protein
MVFKIFRVAYPRTARCIQSHLTGYVPTRYAI